VAAEASEAGLPADSLRGFSERGGLSDWAELPIRDLE
jgi:hypothetical protein